MKRAFLLAAAAGLLFATHAAAARAQDAPRPDAGSVTLYGPQAHNQDTSRALYSFKTGAFASVGWDLAYGALYVGEDHDWLEVAPTRKARTAVRDLGAHDWADAFDVPYVEPFPKLKEGEERVISVDASGRDGEDGAPGAPAAPAADADGVVRQHAPPATSTATPTPPQKPKHDGVPKVDPIFVKAVVGHIYVVHVVDEREDFYVLFRVEALTRGDNCTITWKRVPSPQAEAARGK